MLDKLGRSAGFLSIPLLLTAGLAEAAAPGAGLVDAMARQDILQVVVFATLIGIAAAHVSFGTGPGGGPTISGNAGVSMTGGSGAMILYPDGVAAVFQGTFNVTLPEESSSDVLAV